ncbi:MAG: hypothetical protein IJX78_07135 [Bacilli bacterium]|nr:hypothetical protein [Bacilli bacterium]
MDNEQLNNDAVNTAPENKKKRSALWKIMLVISIIVLLLTLLSTGAVVVKLGKLLPNYTDVVVLIPIWPDSEVVDKDQVWTTETDIDVFKAYYSNDSGEITVKSHDGNKVVAPGVEGTYRFDMRNTGNVALDMTMEFSTSVDMNGLDLENLPIEVRMRNLYGQYVIGGYGKDDYVSFDKVEKFFDSMSVGKNSYIYYELDWRWKFEGNDAFDTLIGNLAVEEDIVLTVEIKTTATQADNENAYGGIEIEDVPTGGDFDLGPYIALNIIIMIIIIILIILELYKRKKDEIDNKDGIENEKLENQNE